MKRHPLLLLAIGVFALLLLSACAGEEEDPPIGVPPTSDVGTPVLAPTEAIFEPAAQSPDELGTPGVDDTSMDEAEELTAPVREDETADAFNVTEDMIRDDLVAVEIGDVLIPLPERVVVVDAMDEADEGAIRSRSNRATFIAPDLSPEQVIEYYAEALPAAGFDANVVEGGEEENLLVQFVKEDHSGLLSVVDEGAETNTRFVLAVEEMIE